MTKNDWLRLSATPLRPTCLQPLPARVETFFFEAFDHGLIARGIILRWHIWNFDVNLCCVICFRWCMTVWCRWQRLSRIRRLLACLRQQVWTIGKLQKSFHGSHALKNAQRRLFTRYTIPWTQNGSETFRKTSNGLALCGIKLESRPTSWIKSFHDYDVAVRWIPPIQDNFSLSSNSLITVACHLLNH